MCLEQELALRLISVPGLASCPGSLQLTCSSNSCSTARGTQTSGYPASSCRSVSPRQATSHPSRSSRHCGPATGPSIAATSSRTLVCSNVSYRTHISDLAPPVPRLWYVRSELLVSTVFATWVHWLPYFRTPSSRRSSSLTAHRPLLAPVNLYQRLRQSLLFRSGMAFDTLLQLMVESVFSPSETGDEWLEPAVSMTASVHLHSCLPFASNMRSSWGVQRRGLRGIAVALGVRLQDELVLDSGLGYAK